MNPNYMYRFLKSRENVNENAKLISSLMEAGRGVDAVLINPKNLEANKKLLEYSGISYYLVGVEDHILLIYPNDERDKYMNIMNELKFGGAMIEYSGMSYAEADSVKDFLQAARVSYNIRIDDERHVRFLISNGDKDCMEYAIEALKEEANNAAGNKFLNNKNKCWANAISQIAQAVDNSEYAYIGTEGGTSGVFINADGAVVIRQKARGEYISRMDPEFSSKIQHVVIDELKGDTTPVKAVFGELAKDISYGMSMEDIRKPALTKEQAMSILDLKEFPTLENLVELKEDEKSDKKAVHALMRMNLCRSIKLDGYERMTKQEKAEYNALHAEHIEEFEGGQHERG